MTSKRARPTPTPGGPALVRPAVGILLLSLSGTACGDDGSSGTANTSEPPMVLDSGPPMSDAGELTTSTTTGDPPPMPNPTNTNTDTDGTSGSSGTGSGTSGSDTMADGATTDPPPMPPPTTGG